MLNMLNDAVVAVATTRRHKTVKTKFGDVHVVEQAPALPAASGESLPAVQPRTIFCFHGDTKRSTWQIYEPALAPLAAAGFRVFAFDMPGYGQSTGVRSSYRDTGVRLFQELHRVLCVPGAVILAGRAIGGRVAIECANGAGKLVSHLVLTHPQAPPEDVLRRIKKSVLLTWAVDDRFGQPFAGPHGAHYFLRHVPCNLCAWRESEYGGDAKQFYSGLYVERIVDFLTRTSKEKRRRRTGKAKRKPAVFDAEPVPAVETAVKTAVKTAIKTAIKIPAKIPANTLVKAPLKIHSSKKAVSSQRTSSTAAKAETAAVTTLIAPRKLIQDPDGLRDLFLNTPFGRLHMRVQGAEDAPVYFVMHGDGKSSCCEHWAPIMGPLSAAGYRVISISMPGYGRSSGSRRSFRGDVVNVVKHVLDNLGIKTACIAGRSVGGKACFLLASALGRKRVPLVVATHPVAPPASVLSSVKQPVMLTWACDDAATNPACAGHPYFGPKGAHYFVKLTGADLLSWYERDYDLCSDFYTQVYCQKVLAFLRRHKFKPKRRKQTS